MRVLISRLSAMGDVVCTLPVAVAFKQSFPEGHITWAVQPGFAPIVERCHAVDEVVTVHSKSLRDDLAKVRRLDPFDIAIEAQGLTKSALVVAVARAKQKLGYHWQRELAPLFSQRVRPDRSSLHVVDQYVDVARAAGCAMSRADFGLAPRDEDFVGLPPLPERYAVVHPGGGWASKRWSPENFAQVINHLVGKSVTPVLIGTKSEQAAANEILAKAPTAISLVGQTTIPQLIALISRCEIHVGGDTGSTHIAAALGRPCVGLYLVTKPVRSCPYGQVGNCPEPTLSNVLGLVESLV